MNLDSQLEQDCIIIARFNLCHILLMNDTNYPWFILVPERDNIQEIHQLRTADQVQLIHESSRIAKTLTAAFNADKLNIAALGNVVPQLHIHHVVRYQSDPTWPEPVWGKLPARPYSEPQLSTVIAKFKSYLSKDIEYFV